MNDFKEDDIEIVRKAEFDPNRPWEVQYHFLILHTPHLPSNWNDLEHWHSYNPLGEGGFTLEQAIEFFKSLYYGRQLPMLEIRIYNRSTGEIIPTEILVHEIP